MEVKEAVQSAIQHVSDLFDLDSSSNIALEEVEYMSHGFGWNITVGFSRRWDHQRPSVAATIQPLAPKRQYRVVQMNGDGEIESVKIRQTSA